MPWRRSSLPIVEPMRVASRAAATTSRSHISPSVRIGGSARESFAKALHAPAFVIDGDHERGVAQVADLRGQSRQLLHALEIAREQDDAADQRMRQTARGRRR